MEKIFTCIKNIGVWHSFEKNETATMFFLKKPFLVFLCFVTLSTIRILIGNTGSQSVKVCSFYDLLYSVRKAGLDFIDVR